VSYRVPVQRWDSPHGWTFVAIPPEHAFPVTHPWGRTPVLATVNGHTWETSTWRDRKHGAILLLPAAVRGAKEVGEEVDVHLEPRSILSEAPKRRRRPPRG
jgi:hypothetical protein